jgi:hypothetical protein
VREGKEDMNRVQLARELMKVAKSLTAKMTEKTVKRWVDKVNKEIAKANRDGVYAVEPDSTWESVYEFKPIRLQGKYVIFEYDDVYAVGNKRQKDRFNWTNEMNEDDLKWQFRWVQRAIKKGYREA